MSTPTDPSLKLTNDPERESFEITKEELLTLVRVVDQVDPIDFGDLPIKEDEYLENVTESVMNMVEQMQNDSHKNWTVTLIVSLIKTVAENGILEAHLLQCNGSEDKARSFLHNMMNKR